MEEKQKKYIFKEKDLKKMKISDNYLIQGMLGNQEVTILSAKPKVGKTTFAYDLSRHIASGKEFLGMKVQKADVIYYAMDSNAVNMAYIAQQHIDETLANLEIRTPDFLSLDELEKEIMKWRLKNKRKKLFVVIDVLISVNYRNYNGKPLLSNGLNSYEDMMPLLQVYKHIAEEYNIGILLIHHNNKTPNVSGDKFDNINGSTAIQGGLQNMIILEKIDREKLNLYVRGRMLEDNELVIQRQSDGTYILTDDITIQEQTEDTDLVRLINYVSKEGQVEGTANEICSKIKFKNWLAGGLVKQLHKNEEILRQSSIEFSIKKVHGYNYITLICINLINKNEEIEEKN